MGDPHQKTRAACAAVAAALAGTRYAVVGGAACVLLGAGRRTEDVDVVVLKGGVQAARKLLSQAPSINVDPRTRHTTFTPASTDIELLSPPGMFRQAFTEETATLMVTVGDDPVVMGYSTPSACSTQNWALFASARRTRSVMPTIMIYCSS